jgi:TolB-like protein
MTEQLIADLAKIGGLRVISRTSVMQYRKARKPVPTIVRELRVDAIIEGSVGRVGDQVRITARLIKDSRETSSGRGVTNAVFVTSCPCRARLRERSLAKSVSR